MTEEFTYTICVSHKSINEYPTATNIGDIFKSYQAIFNVFGKMKNISKEDCSHKIIRIYSDKLTDGESFRICFDSIVKVEIEDHEDIYNNLKKSWELYNEQNYEEFLNLWGISCKKLQLIIPGFDIDRIFKKKVEKQEEDLIDTSIPGFSNQISKIENIRRAHSWQFE